jgi:hypothetical protein
MCWIGAGIWVLGIIMSLTNPIELSGVPSAAELFPSEDLPMTMQVAMVGSDGIVLAGDTRRTQWVEPTFARPWGASRYGENGTKIQISVNRKIAVSSALDLGTAESIASAIIARLDISEVDLIQERIGIIAKETFAVAQPKLSFQCLVVVSLTPSPKLFSVSSMKVDGEQEAVCQERSRLAVAGDTVNGAIFWAERYYNQDLLSDRKSIAKLVPLCAHLVICARSLNTAMISGLEMVTCTSEKIEFQSEDKVRLLAERAEKREIRIGEMIFNDE